MFSLSPINLSQEGRVKIFRSTGTQKEKMKEVRIRGGRERGKERNSAGRGINSRRGVQALLWKGGGKGEKKRHKGKASV